MPKSRCESRCDAVHGSGFGDHALLAHPLREHRLAERVVDLVRPGVVQIFALEVDASAAGFLGEPFREVEPRRPPDVIGHESRELGLERGVGLRLAVCRVELFEREHQRFGDEPAAVGAEAPARIRHTRDGGSTSGSHAKFHRGERRERGVKTTRVIVAARPGFAPHALVVIISISSLRPPR